MRANYGTKCSLGFISVCHSFKLQNNTTVEIRKHKKQGTAEQGNCVEELKDLGWLFLGNICAWGHSDTDYLEFLCGKGMGNFSMWPLGETVGI